ncbi:MAG: GDP-mannose 4,6-dehydratase [Alphaproteobacteria bacterium]|nr:GDP-mannose 4,6-dehydratase [Alphaproteobacteria bacterium]
MSADRKLVILGANSFAGIAVLRAALKENMTVLGLSRSPLRSKLYFPDMPESGSYTFLQRDINDDNAAAAADILAFNPDYVVDLAGQSMVAESWLAPEQWYQTNIVSKVKLLEALRKLPRLQKYVRVSTPELYGNTESLISESFVYRPSTPYAVSHAAIDMHVMTSVNQYGFPAVLTRFSNFYGPGQQLYRIIPRTIIYARMGRKLPLHGGGTSTRAFIYRDDIGSAAMAALARGNVGEVYHFSTNDFTTIRDLVRKIHALLGTDFASLVEESEDRPGKDAHYLMSDAKARTTLGWRDTVSLEEGVGKTIQWVEDNWQAISKEPLDYIHKK